VKDAEPPSGIPRSFTKRSYASRWPRLRSSVLRHDSGSITLHGLSYGPNASAQAGRGTWPESRRAACMHVGAALCGRYAADAGRVSGSRKCHLPKIQGAPRSVRFLKLAMSATPNLRTLTGPALGKKHRQVSGRHPATTPRRRSPSAATQAPSRPPGRRAGSHAWRAAA
jgi:hypothetical protein